MKRFGYVSLLLGLFIVILVLLPFTEAGADTLVFSFPAESTSIKYYSVEGDSLSIKYALSGDTNGAQIRLDDLDHSQTGNWQNASSSGSITITVPYDESSEKYRFAAQNSSGTVFSGDIFVMIMRRPKFTDSPHSLTLEAGSNGILTYSMENTTLTQTRWEYRTASSSTWQSCTEWKSAESTGTYQLNNVTAAMDGYRYRAAAKNSNMSTTIYSSEAMLTGHQPKAGDFLCSGHYQSSGSRFKTRL